MLVFVPVTHRDAVVLRAGDPLAESPGCAATPSLLEHLGPDTSPEEADYVALNHAGVLALVRTADVRRLVLAADVSADQVRDRRTTFGEITVARLSWSQVQALFADGEDAVEAVAASRHAAGVAGLPEALSTPAVETLLADHDLLWFAITELDELG